MLLQNQLQSLDHDTIYLRGPFCRLYRGPWCVDSCDEDMVLRCNQLLLSPQKLFDVNYNQLYLVTHSKNWVPVRTLESQYLPTIDQTIYMVLISILLIRFLEIICSLFQSTKLNAGCNTASATCHAKRAILECVNINKLWKRAPYLWFEYSCFCINFACSILRPMILIDWLAASESHFLGHIIVIIWPTNNVYAIAT